MILRLYQARAPSYRFVGLERLFWQKKCSNSPKLLSCIEKYLSNPLFFNEKMTGLDGEFFGQILIKSTGYILLNGKLINVG